MSYGKVGKQCCPELIIFCAIGIALLSSIFTIILCSNFIVDKASYHPRQSTPGEAHDKPAEVALSNSPEERVADYTFWLTIATGIMGAATLMLGWYSRTSADAANKSADTAEKALVNLERPYVFFEVTSAGLIGKKPQDIIEEDKTLNYSFHNFGRTPAFITAHVGDVRLIECGVKPIPIDADEPPPIGMRLANFPDGVAIAAGGKYDIPFNIDVFSREADWVDFAGFFTGAGNSKNLWIIGYIKYRDILGFDHVTGYCSMYNTGGQRFLTMLGESYNYTKTYEKKT